MSDRAGDGGALLRNLGVDWEKNLKYCVHLILDHAADGVILNIEQNIALYIH